MLLATHGRQHRLHRVVLQAIALVQRHGDLFTRRKAPLTSRSRRRRKLSRLLMLVGSAVAMTMVFPPPQWESRGRAWLCCHRSNCGCARGSPGPRASQSGCQAGPPDLRHMVLADIVQADQNLTDLTVSHGCLLFVNGLIKLLLLDNTLQPSAAQTGCTSFAW